MGQQAVGATPAAQLQHRYQPGRRRFLQVGAAVVGLGLLSGCSRIPALRSSDPRRIGTLAVENPVVQSWMVAWEQRLSALGHVDGEGIVIERRIAPDNSGFDQLAKELVDMKVNVIMAAGWSAMSAAKK